MAKIEGLDAKLLIDPRVDYEEEPKYIIEKAGDYVRYYQEISTSFSNSSIAFSVVPPSPNVGVSKKVFIDVGVDFEFTGVPAPGGTLFPETTELGERVLLPGTDALRWYPLHQVCESLSVTFNTATVSQNLSDYIEPLARVAQGYSLRREDLSIGPSMHDQYSEYGDFLVHGSGRNPLGDYGENSAEQPRGALRYVIRNGNGVDETTATIRVEWSEMIMMSPMLFQRFEQKSFIGLTNINWVFNLGDLAHMWSHDPVNGATITAISGSFYKNPALRMCYITPTKVEGPIPTLQRYPYYEVQRFKTNLSTVYSSGDSDKVCSNNIQLHSIPNKLYVVIKPSKQFKNDGANKWELADSYARIDSVDIKFDNKNALLGSATSRDLYNLSVYNGLDMSWTAWSRFVGSVLCIDFGHDISLDEDLAGGDRQYEMQMIVVSEGVMTIDGTSSRLDTGLVQASDMLAAAKAGRLTRISHYEVMQFDGGSFFNKLKKLGRKVAHGVGAAGTAALHFGEQHSAVLKELGHLVEKYGPEAAKKIGPLVAKYGPTVAKVAATALPLLLAAGYSEEMAGGALMEMGYSPDDIDQAMKAYHEMAGAGESGGGLVGGRRAQKKRLRERE
jgi:hypothetical protein